MGLTVTEKEERVTGTMDKIFEPPETKAGRNRRRLRQISMVTAVIVLAAGATWAIPKITSTCGWLWSGIHLMEGECVGVTDGSFVFADRFKDVEGKIANENAWVQEQGSYITVALLNPLTATATSALKENEILEQLEGAYLAQHRVNRTAAVGDLRPPIKLVLANEGSTENQWRPVVKELVEMTHQENPLVAVVGMGISICQTEQAAVELSKNGIPMVGSIITAVGLEYSKINGLIRVSPDSRDYVGAINGYLKTQARFKSAILAYDINSDTNCDLFTKTLAVAIRETIGGLIKFADLTYRGGGIDGNVGPGQFAPLVSKSVR